MKYTDTEQNLIILSSFEKLTYALKCAALDGLKSYSPDLNKLERALIKSGDGGVYNKVKENFYSAAYRKGIFNALESRGVECVTLASRDYPEALREIPSPPVVLFLKGRRELLNTKCFSVVGSRRTAPNMLKECKRFAKELSAHFTIVTGMADGADSAAIEGALDSGKIISVLANGFDYCYPAANSRLFGEVERKGLLLSEYFPTTPPRSYHFPVRNRIIAGLSEGTLIVSAGKKSGALITADYCTEFNRELFVFPYSLGVSSGEGCNFLIKSGAALVQNPLDILSAFGLDCNPTKKQELSVEEERLYLLIRESGEAFAPVLAEMLGVQPFKLIPLFSSLEIKGLIVRLGGNRYAAV